MNIKHFLPRYLRFFLLSVGLIFSALILVRLVFLGAFFPSADVPPWNILAESFYIGAKFDLRLALVVNLPIMALAWIPPFSLPDRAAGRRLWVAYLTLAGSALAVFYFADFGYYAYLENRLNATVIRFFYNARESFRMVMETYPVIWMALGLVVFAVSYAALSLWMLRRIGQGEAGRVVWWKKTIATFIVALLVAGGIYGKISYYPLRWSDAFFSTHAFASSLALNPVLYFFETLKNREKPYDIDKVKHYYDSMADFLGVENKDPKDFNFERQFQGGASPAVKPNVVIVILESFCWYKTGLSGNPLHPTPNFDQLANNGLLFSRFYTPCGGTARSVWTTITGIPDVELVKTSSRNPLVVNQHTIINAFEGYEKFYFLGGSTSWGNIRGLLLNNIPDLHLYEEGSYSSPTIDVWGISDLSLFLEANKVFNGLEGKPFFAVIQTSGNHRPYTIPEDNRGFKTKAVQDSEVSSYGFPSAAAYNSFRFMDHSIGEFIKAASKEAYFENTIFVFYGDHGLLRPADHLTAGENQLGLTDLHVPLVIYSPKVVREPRRVDKVASEVDILPTVAGLVGHPYRNTTLGRDLLSLDEKALRCAFTIYHSQIPEVGLITDDFYFLARSDGTKKRLHRIGGDEPRKNVIDLYPDKARELETFALGMYQTAKFIRHHNQPLGVNPHTLSRQGAEGR